MAGFITRRCICTHCKEKIKVSLRTEGSEVKQATKLCPACHEPLEVSLKGKDEWDEDKNKVPSREEVRKTIDTASTGNLAAVEPLLNIMDHSQNNFLLLMNVLTALDTIKNRNDTGKCITALENKNFHIRRGAVWILADRGDKEALDALIGALEDPDDFIRLEAVIGLGKINDKRAGEPLKRAAEDDSSADVCMAAKKALAGLYNGI